MSNQFYPLVVDALQTTIPTPDVKFVFLPCQAPLTLASEGYVVEVIQEALKQETRRRFSMTVNPVALMDLIALLSTRDLWEGLTATISTGITPSTFLAPFFQTLRRSGEADVHRLVKAIFDPLLCEISHRLTHTLNDAQPSQLSMTRGGPWVGDNQAPSTTHSKVSSKPVNCAQEGQMDDPKKMPLLTACPRFIRTQIQQRQIIIDTLDSLPQPLSIHNDLVISISTYMKVKDRRWLQYVETGRCLLHGAVSKELVRHYDEQTTVHFLNEMRQTLTARKVLDALAKGIAPSSSSLPPSLICGHIYVAYRQGGFRKVQEEVQRIIRPLFEETRYAIIGDASTPLRKEPRQTATTTPGQQSLSRWTTEFLTFDLDGQTIQRRALPKLGLPLRLIRRLPQRALKAHN